MKSDVVVKANEAVLDTQDAMTKIIQASNGEEISLDILRAGKTMKVVVAPVADESHLDTNAVNLNGWDAKRLSDYAISDYVNFTADASAALDETRLNRIEASLEKVTGMLEQLLNKKPSTKE